MAASAPARTVAMTAQQRAFDKTGFVLIDDFFARAEGRLEAPQQRETVHI